MKVSLAAIVGLGLVAAPAFADPPSPVEAMYEERCSVCHATGENGAPLTDKLQTLTAAAIVEKLTTGTMASMASGMTDEEKRGIAQFLTSRAAPKPAQ